MNPPELAAVNLSSVNGAELRTGRLCGIKTRSLTGEKGVVYYLNMYSTEEPGHAQTGG